MEGDNLTWSIDNLIRTPPSEAGARGFVGKREGDRDRSRAGESRWPQHACSAGVSDGGLDLLRKIHSILVAHSSSEADATKPAASCLSWASEATSR